MGSFCIIGRSIEHGIDAILSVYTDTAGKAVSIKGTCTFRAFYNGGAGQAMTINSWPETIVILCDFIVKKIGHTGSSMPPLKICSVNTFIVSDTV